MPMERPRGSPGGHHCPVGTCEADGAAAAEIPQTEGHLCREGTCGTDGTARLCSCYSRMQQAWALEPHCLVAALLLGAHFAWKRGGTGAGKGSQEVLIKQGNQEFWLEQVRAAGAHMHQGRRRQQQQQAHTCAGRAAGKTQLTNT